VNVTGIVLLGDASSNYQLSSSTITTTGTITKKYIYFSIPNKTYDGSSTIVKYDLSGVYASDASFVSASGLIYFSTATVGQDIPINTNTITLNGSKSSNYDAFYLNNPPYTSSLSRVTGNIVQKALDVSSAFTKIYDATINYTTRIDLSGVVQSDMSFVDFSYTIVASLIHFISQFKNSGKLILLIT
jgi:ABC-type transporter Mla MlaB component